MFIHGLYHSLLIVIELQRNESSVHMNNFHVVLGKIAWILHAFLYFIEMPLRQANGHILPFQKRIAIESAVWYYGLSRCIFQPLCQYILFLIFRHSLSSFMQSTSGSDFGHLE